MNRFKSGISGITFPALPEPRGTALLAALAQLEQSQWWPIEQLRSIQHEQLLTLLNHAVKTVPYYQQQLSEIGYKPGQAWDEKLWSTVPILGRQQLQKSHEQLKSLQMPEGHYGPAGAGCRHG